MRNLNISQKQVSGQAKLVIKRDWQTPALQVIDLDRTLGGRGDHGEDIDGVLGSP